MPYIVKIWRTHITAENAVRSVQTLGEATYILGRCRYMAHVEQRLRHWPNSALVSVLSCTFCTVVFAVYIVCSICRILHNYSSGLVSHHYKTSRRWTIVDLMLVQRRRWCPKKIMPHWFNNLVPLRFFHNKHETLIWCSLNISARCESSSTVVPAKIRILAFGVLMMG